MIEPVFILGPTAVGKTSASIELAKKINGEIISADSMQVYRFMNIGTAKSTMAERQGIPHHLIDIVNPDETWNVSCFIERTNQLIKEISERKKTPIIVGGTGLYINAFINGYDFPIVSRDDGIRVKLNSLTSEELYSKLQLIDPVSSEKINVNDKKKIIRALEVFEQTGIPISKMQKSNPDPKYKLFCLNTDRDLVYLNINNRVDKMMCDGLIEEVKGLLAKGYSKELNSLQALGYKESIKYIEGEISIDDTIELIKRKTRNFARRQLTWLRRFQNTTWIDTKENPAVAIYSILI